MTYPDTEVSRFLRDHFTPVRLDIHHATQETRQYGAIWTPTFLFLDAEGIEYRRSIGYLPPDEFRAELGIGLGILYLAQQDHAGALAHLREVASRFPNTWFGPEAQYWIAVVDYKRQGKAEALLSGWNQLLDQWPDSRWAHSVRFIRP